MWFNVIFAVSVFVIAFIGFTSYSIAKDNTNNSTNKQTALEQLENQAARDILNSKLDKLQNIPAFDERPVGAMCYDTAAPLERTQYICPVCGEMTLYPWQSTNIDDVSYYRKLVKKINKIQVTLDESQLCEKCSPDAKTRKLYLIVKNDKNAKPNKISNFSANDIQLLYEYSEGMKEHTTLYGKMPLINFKSRLEELLGITLKDFEK